MRPLVSQSLQHRTVAGLIAGLALLCQAGARAQSAPPSGGGPIARIEGDDIALHGEVNLVHETGRSFAELASGSEVTVRSGKARIELVGGGEIGICGPAKFSVLRSGATLTVALDYGRIDARLNEAQAVTIFTPLAVATPVPISGGTGELRLGLEQTGKMCLYAGRGAVRVQPQFGDETVVVPQDVEAAFTEGRLESVEKAPHTCSCDALADFAARRESATRIEAGAVAAVGGTDGAASGEKATSLPAKPASEPSVWKVVMPPLSFDASARGPVHPPSPETILLFREVHVENGAVWHGTVTAAAAAPGRTSAQQAKSLASAGPPRPAAQKVSFGQRLRNFFRRLFGGKPKTS